MLIILLIFALIHSLRGIPLSSPCGTLDRCSDLDIRDIQSHFGERAISDIILSCFAVIFACTWSAVHPNIPATTDCAWSRFKRQFVTMVCALLAPEVMTAWALRQRLTARKIMDRYNGIMAAEISQETEEPTSIVGFIRAIFQDSPLPRVRKADEAPQWTLVHGFFLQMGGFILSEGGRPVQVLTVGWHNDERDIDWNIKKGIIDPPLITEEDIEDRSKGDAISKTLVVFQMTWFITQCIGRWSTGLPVTELEVVTLGFAMLNGITYALWWHKPQNAGRPVFLEIKPKIPQGGSGDMGDMGDMDLEEKTTPEPQTNSVGEVPTSETAPISKSSYLWGMIREDFENYASKPWLLLLLLPLRLFSSLLRPLGKLAEYFPLQRRIERGDLRVAMFFSYGMDDSAVYRMTAIIGVLFGSVHLIPSWFLDFVSVQAKWLWRGSAIVITVGPIFLGFAEFNEDSAAKNISGYILVLTLPLYISSRMILLVLSLTSLRSLPPGALQTIDWTTFIPHI